MEVHLDDLRVKFDYRDIDLIFKVMAAIFIVSEMLFSLCQYLEKEIDLASPKFSMEVHLDNL